MPARRPDYAAIQSGWIRAYQARPELDTVIAELRAAEQAIDGLDQVLDAQRPSFKTANPQLYVDAANLRARLAYYREILDGDASSYPFVFHALTYGREGLAEYADRAPDGAVDTLRQMGLASQRGDLSAAVGLTWVASEGIGGWRQAVWDSYLMGIAVGPVAEILTGAGFELDSERWLREVTGLNRDERRRESLELAATGLGIAGGILGLWVAWQQRRRR